MQDHLKAIETCLQSAVPALKYIDEDWGQLDFYSREVPAKFPCALLDVPTISWTNTARGGQTGIATFRVRIATLKLTGSSSKAPLTQQAAAGAIWTLLGDVYRALQGWRPTPETTAMIRTVQRRARRDDGVMMYEMEFTAQVVDDSGQRRPTITAIVSPVITPALQPPAP